MLSGYEHTLTNLRLLSGLRKNEYLQTDSDGNILSYLQDSFIQNLASALYRENWDSTLFCLRKLYETEVSELMTKLFEEEAEKELSHTLNQASAREERQEIKIRSRFKGLEKFTHF